MGGMASISPGEENEFHSRQRLRIIQTMGVDVPEESSAIDLVNIHGFKILLY